MTSFVRILLGAVVLAAGFATEAWAVESSAGWRSTYDMVLKWINFGILAFLLIKFARSPFKAFLSGQKEQLVRELNRKEAEKKAIEEELQKTLQELTESEIRLEGLKERVVADGEKRRQQSIDEARDKSRQMLTEVQKRLENQVLKAKRQLKADLVDSAVQHALEKLPGLVTADDHQKFLDHFLDGTASR